MMVARLNPALGVAVFSLLNLGASVVAGDAIPRISFNVSVPPAIVWLEDGMNRRSGMNQFMPIAPEGMGTVINQIPGADIEQVNMGGLAAEGEEERPDPITHWHLSVDTLTKTDLVLTLSGMGTGLSRWSVMAMEGSLITVSRFEDQALCSSGQVRKIKYTFDPGQHSVRSLRQSTTGGLRNDLEVACGLGFVSSGGVCESLRAKMSAAEAALVRGQREAARGNVGAFLNELQAQAGKHVLEPALTILREEAESVLSSQLISSRKQKAKDSKKVADTSIR